MKTYTQTSATPIGYFDATMAIVEAGGMEALLWRGLAAKVLCNSLGGIFFSVAWKMLMDRRRLKPKALAGDGGNNDRFL